MTGSLTYQEFPAPRLLQRLTPLERREVLRAYLEKSRVAAQSARSTGGPANPTLAIVHGAITQGVMAVTVRGLILAVFIESFVGIGWLHIGWLHIDTTNERLTVLAAIVVLTVVISCARIWQLRRYLATHPVEPPEARNTDHPGIAATPARSDELTLTEAGRASRPRDLPRVIAPDLWHDLSRLNRFFAGQAYEKFVAEGQVRAPEPGQSIDLAAVERAYCWGINAPAVFASIIPGMAVIYGLTGTLAAGTGDVIATIVFVAILVAIWGRAHRRRRQVRQYFAQGN